MLANLSHASVFDLVLLAFASSLLAFMLVMMGVMAWRLARIHLRLGPPIVVREHAGRRRTVMQGGQLVNLFVPRHVTMFIRFADGMQLRIYVVGEEDVDKSIDECCMEYASSLCFGDSYEAVKRGKMDPVDALWQTDFAEGSAEWYFTARVGVGGSHTLAELMHGLRGMSRSYVLDGEKRRC